MEGLILAALEGNNIQTLIDFSLLDTASLPDRLFALGILMHSSISNSPDFTEKLLLALAQAVAKSEYPEAVRLTCLAKFLREAMALEMYQIRVNQERFGECLDLVEIGINAIPNPSAFNPSLKTLFSDALTSVINYINRPLFTQRVAQFALRHIDLLSSREGVLQLSSEDFDILLRHEELLLPVVLPVLTKSCEIAMGLKDSQSRFPLTEIIHKALVYMIDQKLPKTEIALNTVSKRLKTFQKLFTMSQKERILEVYLRVAQSGSVSPDPEIVEKYGKNAIMAGYEEEEKQSQPTVNNKVREFLDALRSAKQSGFVKVESFAEEWRACLMEGEGMVSHGKAANEVIEQVSEQLKTAQKSGSQDRNLWKLVISCLNEMGFKDVQGYRTLVAMAREFIHQGEEEGDLRGGRGQRGRGRPGGRSRH